MGSTINSGKKNWNTEYIKYYPTIKDADKDLYNIVKAQNSSLPEYEDIIGNAIIKKKIMYDTSLTEEKALISKLMDDVKQMLGGRSRRKNKNKTRKSRKRTKKYRKRTRKCRKRTRKYKR